MLFKHFREPFQCGHPGPTALRPYMLPFSTGAPRPLPWSIGFRVNDKGFRFMIQVNRFRVHNSHLAPKTMPDPSFLSQRVGSGASSKIE